MSETMTRIPYDKLLSQVCHEYETRGTVFGVSRIWKAKRKTLPIFGSEKLETPFGPAAGPNTQLAQNIIAAYAAGARFFELKTVQIMDGEELAGYPDVANPVIVDEFEFPVKMTAGRHEFIAGFDGKCGNAWGISFHFGDPKIILSDGRGLDDGLMATMPVFVG